MREFTSKDIETTNFPKNCTTCKSHQRHYDDYGFDGCTCSNCEARNDFHHYCWEFYVIPFNPDKDDGECPYYECNKGEWKLSLPFGTIIISRYQWGEEERTAYYIYHEFGGKNPHSWAILPESGVVGDTTKWRYLDMSQEDIDAYATVGKKWIPGHFEDI